MAVPFNFCWHLNVACVPRCGTEKFFTAKPAAYTGCFISRIALIHTWVRCAFIRYSYRKPFSATGATCVCSFWMNMCSRSAIHLRSCLCPFFRSGNTRQRSFPAPTRKTIPSTFFIFQHRVPTLPFADSMQSAHGSRQQSAHLLGRLAIRM